MKKSIFKRLLIISVILLTFTACNKDDDNIIVEKYPSLEVATQNKWIITSVRLVGYEFANLNIAIDDSQTFTLDKGMPGGYDDININVGFKYGGYPTRYSSAEVNFNDGETTTITLKGCIAAEGCQGFYLE